MSEAERHGRPSDPYRLFFPLGIAFGIAGAAIWPLYHFGAIATYSSRAHMFIQTDCFLYAFVVGFLWTAVPRFTGTEVPSRTLQWAQAAMLVAAATAFEVQLFRWAHVAFAVAHSVLSVSLVRRFAKRRFSPPPPFVLVGVGIAAGLIGALINTGIAWNVIGPDLELLGRRLLSEGMVLLLVLGVGSFLGPRLLGFAELPQVVQIGPTARPQGALALLKGGVALHLAAGATLITSILLEYGWNVPAMAWLRAAVATAVVAAMVRPWRRPAARSTLAWCVWVAHWLMVAALWSAAAFPLYRTDVLHILFMGSFTLMILAVATRVVLSHGGHPLSEERRSWPLRIGLVTGTAAMLARVGAPLTPDSYFSHLSWAALLWIAGIALWAVFLTQRIFTKPDARTVRE